MLIIGSKAMGEWGIRTGRSASDTDYICTLSECNSLIEKHKRSGSLRSATPISSNKTVIRLTSGAIEECEIAWEGSTGEELLNTYSTSLYAPPEVLLALKLSHRYLRNSPHFEKTMNDICLLRSHGYTLPDHMKGWLSRREKETYNYEHPKLNVSKNDFFDASVNYKYDHDSIHQAIKVKDDPAYTLFKPKENDVMCSKDMFDALPYRNQLYAVYEEACVLALERSLVPYSFNTPPIRAFEMALEKVCTSITSGWFREFAWENYKEVKELYMSINHSYVSAFLDGLMNGVVKLHKEE